MRLSYTWPCQFCEYVGTSRRDLQKHKSEKHKNEHKKFIFNKGGNCKFCGNYFEYKHTLRFHEKRCYKNPERIEYKKHDQTEVTRQKIKETNKIRHTMGGYRKGSGRGKKGWYKGYFCDSSWELAYVIYNLEHGIKFERNKEKFKYIFEGKEYNYLPDFIVDGKYVELKGYWSKKWQAKYDQFPKELSIIGKEEIKPYLEYVKNKYGRDFIKLYENNDLYNNSNQIEESRKRLQLLKLKDQLLKEIRLTNREIDKIVKKLKLKKNKPKFIDSTGRLNYSCLDPQILESRRDLILNSGVDLCKFGWVSKVSKITNLSRREINLIVNKFEDLKCKVFYRKSNNKLE